MCYNDLVDMSYPPVYLYDLPGSIFTIQEVLQKCMCQSRLGVLSRVSPSVLSTVVGKNVYSFTLCLYKRNKYEVQQGLNGSNVSMSLDIRLRCWFRRSRFRLDKGGVTFIGLTKILENLVMLFFS